MADIAPHGLPAQGPPMQPVNNPNASISQGTMTNVTPPGSGPQPTNLPGIPPEWNSFPRIARAILTVFEQQGKAAADELEAWIRMKLSQK